MPEFLFNPIFGSSNLSFDLVHLPKVLTPAKLGVKYACRIELTGEDTRLCLLYHPPAPSWSGILIKGSNPSTVMKDKQTKASMQTCTVVMSCMFTS